MNKAVICAASYYKQSYFFSPDFATLPTSIQEDLRVIATLGAEKGYCIITIGFYPDGSVFIESTGQEDDYNFDEIEARLQVNRIEKENEALFHSLQVWYQVFRTEEGTTIQKELLEKGTITPL